MVDTARAEAPLSDLESPALARDQVLDRHADVLQHHLGVADGLFVITEDRQHPLDPEAGRIDGDDDLGLLGVRSGGRIGLAHDDGHGDVRMGHVGRPPFAAVDDIVVAVALDPGPDIGGVGRGDLGLGHQEGGADLARHQRLQPAVLLGRVSVHMEHLHIAGVGGVAVEHLGRPQVAAHHLGEGGVFQVCQARPVLARQEHVPQARLAGGGLHGLHDRRLAVRILAHLGEIVGLARDDLFVEKTAHAGVPVQGAVGMSEVHVVSSFFRSRL